MLVSTVGPFVKWGEPAVRAAIAAKGMYIDSTGEPPFIRRVFDEFGAPAERAGAALLTAMGYDYVPGALAGALALEEAGLDAVRVDVGYYAFGAGDQRRHAPLGGRDHARGRLRVPRRPRCAPARIAERVRSFHVKGKDREAVSIGGAEHLTLPEAYPRLLEVNVYLGWFGALARPLQAGSLAGSLAMRLPGVRGALKFAGDRLVEVGGGADEPGSGISWVVGEAYDAAGEKLAEVHLTGGEPYALTAGILAWAARRAAAGGVDGTGALGPVQAFGLRALEEGCREAGLDASATQPSRERPDAEHRAREQPGGLEPAPVADLQPRLRGPVEQPPAQLVEPARRPQHGRLGQR